VAAKIMMEAERKMARQDAAQQAVGRVVGRAYWLNGDDVPKFLEAYNGEMDARGVEDALRLEYFCWVVADPIHAEVKELRNAHGSWESFVVSRSDQGLVRGGMGVSTTRCESVNNGTARERRRGESGEWLHTTAGRELNTSRFGGA
jgi:hypothetical protein